MKDIKTTYLVKNIFRDDNRLEGFNEIICCYWCIYRNLQHFKAKYILVLILCLKN